MTEPRPPFDGSKPGGVVPLQRARGLAKLAFGSASRVSGVNDGRTLALLRVDALELDLSDPAQRSFDDYELLELLGEGGMGVVYRARQVSLDREVAIKLLSAGPWASRDFIARFEREAQNAARMQHPNIVAIHEVGSFEGLQFFSMQLVRGESLSAKLRRGETFTPRAAAALIRTAAEAVGYAHSLGVLHLDLKPGNLLLDEAGTPYIADFGLARRLEHALAAENEEVSGTPAYMAPEQAQVRAHKLTAATDIWGLGAILYELLTGQPPFRAGNAQDTLKLVLQGKVRAPRRWRPLLPLDLQAIVLRCLNREPAGRYPSARVLADDLARFVEGRPVEARPLNPPQKVWRWARREPRLAVTALLAFVLLAGGLVATTTQWRRADANAHVAQANAHTASERLWDSRDASNLRFMDSGEGWKAAPLLASSIAEMEAAGESGRALAERKKLGIIENANPSLIDVLASDGVAQTSAFSPDGSKLAVCTDPLQVRLYDLESGRLLWTRKLDPKAWDYLPIARAMFSPDGQWLLIQLRDVSMAPFPSGFDILIEVATGDLHEPPGSLAEQDSVTFSANGRYAILTDAHGRSQFWATDPWRPLSPARRLAANPDLPFVFALIAADGRRFAYTHHGQVALVDAATLREHAIKLPAAFSTIGAWAASPDWRWLVVGDHDGRIAAIDTQNLAVHEIVPKPFHAVSSFQFGGRGTLLAAAAGESGVYVWRWPLGDLVAPPFGTPHPIEHVEVDDVQNRVLALAGDGTGSLWQLAPTPLKLDRNAAMRIGDDFDARVPASGNFLQRRNTGAAWLPRAGLIAGASGATRVMRLPPSPDKHAHAAPIRPTILRFDGRRLVAVEGSRVQILDALRETSLAAPIELAQPPGFAEIAGTNATLVVVEGRRLHAYNAVDGKPRFAPVELTNSPLHVESSPDGRRVVTGWLDHDASGNGEVLELWSLDDGRRLAGPVRVPTLLDGLAFSASGRRLAAWSWEQISLRDGNDLRPVSPALADLRTPGYRKNINAGLFDQVAFDGDDLLVTERLGNGKEITGTVLHRYAANGQTRSESLPQGWTAMLPLPGRRGLLVVPDSGPLSLRAANGKLRPLPDDSGTDAELGNALAVSADGRWLARSLRDGVEIFDADGGRRTLSLRAMLPLPDRVWQLAFSADGARLMARSVRNRWLVWNLAPEQRPMNIVARELALRGIQRSENALPASAQERAALRARDPGAPPIAQAISPEGSRTVAGGAIAPRSPDAPAATLDLTQAYNLGLDEVSRATEHSPADFGWLPRGVQRLLGVDYDIRGVIQLRDPRGFVEQASAMAPAGVHVPIEPRRVAAIDVLAMMGLDCAQAIPTPPLAFVRLDYADGSRDEIPIHCYADVFPWRRISGLDDRARIATLGLDARLMPVFWRPVRVYAVNLANPHPGKTVRGVSLMAAPGAGAAPMILAVTLQPAVAARHVGMRASAR